MTRFKDKTRDNIYFPVLDEKQNQLFAFVVSTILEETTKHDSLGSIRRLECLFLQLHDVFLIYHFCWAFQTHTASWFLQLQKKNQNPISSDVNNIKKLKPKNQIV